MDRKPPAGLVERSEDLFRRTTREAAYAFSIVRFHHLIQFGVCLFLIAFHIYLLSTPLLNRFEYIFLDFFLRQRPVLQVHPAVAYIDMAEDSIQAIGRWPWPRRYHATLVHILNEWKARAIVFDVVFSEESNAFDDGALEEAIKESGRVYLPVVMDRKSGGEFWLHSLPRLEQYARGVGHINITPDVDGTVRRIKTFLKVDEKVYPHLALRVAYDYLGTPDKVASFEKNQPELLINWVGRWKDTFHHFSYADILKSYEALQKGERPIVSPDEIRGKMCIVGLTAFGLSDIKVNPLEPAYPGPGIHANVINSILVNQFIRSASFRTNAVCLVIIGLIVSILLVSSRNVSAFLGSFVIGFGWIFVSYLVFLRNGIWLYVAHVELLIVILFVFSAGFLMIVKNRELMRLFKLATQDGLTGLCVIRYFRILLNQAADEAHRRGKALSVILGDVDHFKNFNDTYGHACGDMVLKEIARIIQTTVSEREESKNIQEKNVVARYGGEEIIIMLRNCNLQEAAFKVGERIRRNIEQERFMWEGKPISVTISLGVSMLHLEETIPDQMIHRADEALYRAKESGRNRVCVEDYKSQKENSVKTETVGEAPS